MFIDDLRKCIRFRKPIATLLDVWIAESPNNRTNPLINLVLKFYTKKELQAMVLSAVRGYLPSTIQDNQEALRLLATPEGRKWLHENLDGLIDYLISPKFSEKIYKCPACKGIIIGRTQKCCHCEVSLVWK